MVWVFVFLTIVTFGFVMKYVLANISNLAVSYQTFEDTLQVNQQSTLYPIQNLK